MFLTASSSSLILASASPNRLAVLNACGIDARVEVADIDEQSKPRESAVELTTRLAATKCLTVVSQLGESEGESQAVVAADTVVDFDGTLLGKPTSLDDARKTLHALAGRSHNVVTGVAIGLGGLIEVGSASTTVTFRSLSSDDVDRYLLSGEYKGKAGSYGIQGMASIFIEHIEGSYHNVVGLPMHSVELLLGRFGLSLQSWRVADG